MEDSLRQSIQSEAQSEQESEDDEMLIGNSDRKPLGSNFGGGGEENLFSEEYVAKKKAHE